MAIICNCIGIKTTTTISTYKHGTYEERENQSIDERKIHIHVHQYGENYKSIDIDIGTSTFVNRTIEELNRFKNDLLSGDESASISINTEGAEDCDTRLITISKIDEVNYLVTIRGRDSTINDFVLEQDLFKFFDVLEDYIKWMTDNE